MINSSSQIKLINKSSIKVVSPREEPSVQQHSEVPQKRNRLLKIVSKASGDINSSRQQNISPCENRSSNVIEAAADLSISSNHQLLTKTAEESAKGASKTSKVIKKTPKRTLVTHNSSENHHNLPIMQPVIPSLLHFPS